MLDGEIALRSHSDSLRYRQPAEVATPSVTIAFDVLRVKGHDVSLRPLLDRRPRLEDLVAGADLVVDDEPQVAEMLRDLTSKGYEVEVALNGADGVRGTFDPVWSINTMGNCS